MKATLFLFMLFVFQATCVNGQSEVKGSGYILTQQRETPIYNSIEINGTFSVFISPDELRQVVVEADNNLFPYIKTEVKNDTLRIYVEDSVYIKKYAAMNIFLSVPHISKIRATSGARLDGSPHIWKNTQTDIEAIDNAEVKWHTVTQILNVTGRDEANIKLKGNTGLLNIVLEQKSELDASELKAQEAEIDISNQSKAVIEVSDKIKYSLSQKSKLKYIGAPNISKAQVSSGSQITGKKQ